MGHVVCRENRSHVGIIICNGSKLHENVALDAHVQLNVAFPVQGGGIERCTLDDALVGLVGFSHSAAPCCRVSMTEILKDTEFAVLALNCPIVSALKEMAFFLILLLGSEAGQVILQSAIC